MSEVEVVGDGAGSGSSGVVPSGGGGSAVGGNGAAATPTPAADGRVVRQLDSVVAGRPGGVSSYPRAWYRSVSRVRAPPSAY